MTTTNTWIDFCFIDKESGEQFFVELNRNDYPTDVEMHKAARAIAKENFDAPKFCGVYSAEEAEILGYDTY